MNLREQAEEAYKQKRLAAFQKHLEEFKEALKKVLGVETLDDGLFSAGQDRINYTVDGLTLAWDYHTVCLTHIDGVAIEYTPVICGLVEIGKALKENQKTKQTRWNKIKSIVGF